ncbi:unnamed protein product [Linum tenue]|uniref:Uncharacterized protein n=1 Tax=Linum tenue TaxID=586396 RepID=A0AAV0IIW3_9ROSI|nr:unnamed protein product [Linum tenue]
MIFGLLMEALGVGDFIRRGVGGRVLESPFAGGSCASSLHYLFSHHVLSSLSTRQIEQSSENCRIHISDYDYSESLYEFQGRFSGEFGAQDLDGHRWNCMGF